MTRQNPWHSVFGLVLGVVFVVLLTGIAAGENQPPPARKGPGVRSHQSPDKPPTTQPSDEEAQRKLRELMEMRDRGEFKTPKKGDEPKPKPKKSSVGSRRGKVVTPPRAKKGSRESLDELKRRARSSTQGAATEETDEDDFFGPLYAPASPPSTQRELLTRGRSLATQPESKPTTTTEPEHPEPPISRQTDDLEWFNYDGMPWEDVIYDFAERIGKPLLDPGGELMIGGELTYRSERKFTKEEAIDELNLILHMLGYRFVETENHIFVVTLSEMPMHVPVEATYPSRAAFEQADPRPMDYVIAYIQIVDYPAKDIQFMFETMAPDYMTVMALEESNQLKLVGMTRDIHKILGLMDRISIDEDDPRETKIFKIETNARDIERMLRDILELGTTSRIQPSSSSRGRRGPTVPTVVKDESPVRMSADDRTNSLIVRATPTKLKEIEELIKQIDVKPPDIEFHTKVYQIENANVSDVAELLNTIFSQEQGRTTPAWQQARQAQQLAQQRAARSSRRTPTRRTTQQRTTPQQAAAPEELMGEGLFERAKKTIRIAPDERTNSLVVYANKDGHERVETLLKEIDAAQPSNLQTIALEHAEGTQILPTLNQIVQSLTSSGGRGRGPSIVLDEANNQFHVLAEREQMQQIEEVIRKLDVPMPESLRHVVELQNLAPSRVAQMIQPLLMSSGSGRVPAPVRSRGRSSRRVGGGGQTTTSSTGEIEIIPLDEAQLLIVICPEEEWARVEETIKLWDEGAISSSPQLQTFEVQHGNPQAIVTTLNGLYRGGYDHPALGRSQVLIQAEGSAILVYAIKPALEEIAPLVEALDREDASKYEILPLAHADANQVAQQAQLLFGSGGGVARGRGRVAPVGDGGVVIQAETTTNSLIVQADVATLEKIKDYAMAMDHEVGAQQPERKFYSLKNAAPRDVVSAINSLFAAGGGGRGGRFRGQPTGTQVTALVVGNDVVVDAPAEKQQEIAALVQQLDDRSDRGITTLLVRMPGADVRSVAQRLTQAFQDRVKQQGVTARFEPDASTETILVTYSKDVQEDAEKLLDEYRTLSEPLVNQSEFYQLEYANANEVARWLRTELVAMMTKQFGRNAAQQVTVTPETRTNRIIISAPQVAVKAALPLLEQYDVPQKELEISTPVETVTRKLPGLDVANLANQLNHAFRAINSQRADKLTTTFGYDRLTEMLIITTPTDTMKKVDELIAQFVTETEGMAPEQKFIEVKNADANYVAGQVRQIMQAQIMGRHGREMWSRVNIQVDTRLNRVILNAPQFAIEMAEALVAQLDQEPTTESQLRTIALENADANTVLGVLNNIFREKIRAKTLQVSVEPLTNSLIVGGTTEDFEDIKKWSEELDTRAGDVAGLLRIYDLDNANPWEVFNVLNQTFVQTGWGRKQPPSKQIKLSIVAGRSLVVQAPPEKMKEIEDLIGELDAIGSNTAEIRTYELPGVGNRLNDLARQIRDGFNATVEARERRISVAPYPPADALIITALPDQFEKIENLMNQFKELVTAVEAKTEFFELKYVEAGQIVSLVQDMVQKRTNQSGKRGGQDFSVQAEPRTNRLIVTAPESVMPDVQVVIAELDVDVPDDNVVTIELKYADPMDVRNMINEVFRNRGPRGTSAQQQVFVTVSNNTLIVKAPPKKMEQINELIARIDAEDPAGLQIKTYQLKVLNATQVASQVQMYLRSMGTVTRRGQMQPGAFPEPTTNTLVVIAPEKHLIFIDGLIAKLETGGDLFTSEVRAYELKFARAELVAQNVDAMLKAKVAEREGQVRGGKLQQRTAVFQDVNTNRLFVYAPDEYHALAAELIRVIDEDVDTGEIVHIIRLEKGDAQQRAQTLQQIMQPTGRRGSTSTRQVRITADTDSNSILLAGLPRDVAELEGYIKEMELNSDAVPELQIFRLENASAFDVAETLNGIFGTGRRGQRGGSPTEAVTITADEYYNRLLVTANKRRMREVEGFIEQLDTGPTLDPNNLLADTSGRQLYFVDVYRGDAWEISWDVRDMLPDEERGGPIIEADWFGKYIKVKCRPNEFDQVLALIREFEKRAKAEKKVVVRQVRGEMDQILAYLRERTGEENLEINYLDKERPKTIVETLWGDDEEPAAVLQRRERDHQREGQVVPTGSSGTDVRPFQLGLPVSVVLLGDDALGALFDEQPPKKEPVTKARSVEPIPKAVPLAAQASEQSKNNDESASQHEKTRIVVQPDGSVVIYGPKNDVDEIEETLDLLEEDLAVGEVIRIFQFKYGDVSAAAEVIQIMFNERTTIRLPQQQPRSRDAQQQRGQEGRGEQQGMMDQLRGMVGGRQTDQRGRQTDGRRVRIATDPAHNYLIIKCEESDLPEIKQLLRELDIPPGEVELKVFQLRNLDASETAENIKQVLGISKAKQRRSSTSTSGRGGRNAQAQLMEMLQQQLVSVPGVEGGAKVEQVEIVPNAITNSLMVSSPPEVMKIIENIINELEDLEGYDVVGIYHYQLDHAKVDDVLPLLQDIFTAVGGGGGGRPGQRGRSSGSPGAMGPVTVSGDPRVNTIIFTAEAKDREIVEAQIRMLDIEGSIAEAEMYVCQFSDAAAIADVVDAIYGNGGGSGRGVRGSRGQQPISGQEVRIVAEPMTNTIVVWGPPDKRDVIFAKIEELDLRGNRDFREIPIVFANPETLAETLLQMFGGGSAQSARGRQGQRASTGTGGIMIIGDKIARKLLVRAPEQVFAQIEEVVATLDQQNEQMQIRRFALEHTQAEFVVESVRGALTEYVQMAGGGRGGDLPFDPFTVVPDTRTNSVVVVGSQQTFAFVESVLAVVDVETPIEHRKDFRVFVLDKADAEAVAQAINDFAAGAGSGTSGQRQSSGRRGAGGAISAQARELDVYASAEPTANTVMVFGKPEDIDLVEDQVIVQYENAVRHRLQIATIPVTQVKPTEIVSFIWQFVGDLEAEQKGGRRSGGNRSGTATSGPQIIPNDNAGTLVVRGTRGDIEYVRELVEQFDQPGLIQQNITVVKIPLGQDVTRLADEIERLVNDSEEDIASQIGRDARRISVAPDEYTHTVILAGDASLFGLAKSILDQLAAVRRDNVVTRVINLGNLSAEDASQMIEELQKRGGSSGSSRRGSTRPTGSSRQRSGRGRGDATWPHLREVEEMPWQSPPLACLSPYVSLAMLRPSLEATLVAGLFDDENPAPPDKQTGQGMLAFGPRALEEDELLDAPEPKSKPEPKAEPTPPVAGLTGITGELRGEVLVSEIDSKRIIVTGDESDVAFIEQILGMMEHSASPAVIEVFTIENAKATVLAPIIEQAIQAMVDVRTQSPGPEDRFSISAEGRSNSLIVSASERMMAEIAALVAQLDVTKPDVEVGPRAVALKHVRAAEAVAMIIPALEELYRIQEVPKESQAAVSAIDRSNSVLIVGTPQDVETIERLLQTIDIEITAEDEQASFVYADAVMIQLQNGQAEDVAKILTDMIEEQQKRARDAKGAKDKAGEMYVTKLRLRTADGRELPELDFERPIGIIPEPGTNSLIIFSSRKNNEALGEIVQVFDTLPIGADTDLRAIALNYAAAEEVADVLDKVFSEGKGALRRPSEGDGKGLDKGKLPPVPPGLTGKGLPYNLVVQHDVRSNTVIVIGRKDAVLLAASLIAELDKSSLELAGQPRVIELKRYPAEQLAEKLNDWLADRAKNLGVDKNVARDSAVIIPDDRSNRLVVLANDDIFEMVEDLAMELDAAEPYRIVDIRTRRLEHADAQKLQGILEELFDRKQKAEKDQSKEAKDSLSVLADTRSNSLLMTGTRDYLSEADDLIDNLDQQFDPTVVLVVRPIKLNSATNIASKLQEMVDKALKEQDSKLQGTPIHIAADSLSDSLLMAAAAEDMVMLERWVEILDRPSEVGRMTVIVPLQNASAEEVSKAAGDIFKSAEDVEVTVTHDASTNSVVAFGPPALLKDIAAFVRQLDQTEAGAGALVRIFHLKEADAEKAGELLTNILEGRGGSVGGSGRGGGGSSQEIEKQVILWFQHDHPELGLETLQAVRSDIVVISDLRTNTLVVTAPPKSMALMESLITRIDVPPDEAKIRVFALRNADAEQMVVMLEKLFERKTASSSGRSSGEETERELTLGEGLGGEGGRQEISFTTDLRTNSVIAAGTKGYLDLVEELILELDSRAIEDRKTYVYTPRNIPADMLASTLADFSAQEQDRLQELGDEISLAVRQEAEIGAISHEELSQIILSYSPRKEDEVLDIVRELDQPPPQVSIEVLIVEVLLENALELGIEFAFQDLQYVKAGPQDTTTFDFVGGTDVGAAGAGLGGFTFTITGRDFNFLLRTLQSESSLNVLSRPHIVAMDNQPAKIEITDDVPYISGTQTSSTGQISTSVGRQDVGIKLEVTPQINPDGFVRMEIMQEVSALTDSTITVGTGLTSPIFFKRIAETVVTVQDNETVVLGGMIQSRDSNVEQKIPIMGDMPVLGPLFRFTNDQQRRSELLVILTPRIIRTVEDYREYSIENRDQTGLIPDEVKTNPLMRGLQLQPDELVPVEGEELFGPFGEPLGDGLDERSNGLEEYGPLRPARRRPATNGGNANNPGSRDVPIEFTEQTESSM